ncbi:hypothetical protein Ahy_B09g095269 [Arachis hypogaea]|uniref:SWIM-type domain-containing protein n=1 Tax=Arachis hypogaea TaxID=3818 RepID=A0A444XE53_ARAHY|nr:hypothetical protein Ahy_B09g095269 [Arachis hypogaea]
MKTPPNSEDELQSDEDSDEFPIFRNGARFGELHLQVGMKFNTKYEFREVVREYTIQEGRRIKAVCKVKECAWVVYASRDCDDSYWQIKTFNDDHTYARENTNRAANMAWVTSKLVKKNWMPIWTSDEDYEKFEVHGHSTNMVVDLGKRLCTCQFWMLTGIPCVHACAALARVNKRPEDFCHQLCTMEAYNKTYTHHINSLPGQSLWEKSMYTQPQAPNIRRRPGALTKKRRKDADEGNSGIVGVKGHTKRGCSKKRLDEVVAAVAATKAAADKAKSNDAASASEAGPQPHTTAAPADKPSAVEIDISQPNYEGSQDIAGSAAPAPSRPHKLPTKRRSSPPPQSIGASVATSFRLANFMKFVPTPGFKAPRKKNNS